ncbi:MAG: putative glycosidase [Ilumatobacteraceae bacterium]|nr:putative glycosidase [Ilumatobacteraceae bacterium]
MTGPNGSSGRRYGMAVHANIATVASFSPIGERADWYWSHLGSDLLVGTAPHASPLAEVLAYHRDRWSHVARYDDFLPFLTLHRFDADELVELAIAGGMRSVVQTARHRDGFCWWDAPGTNRTSTHAGPLRDVLAEVGSASRRRGLTWGTAYSLIDWSATGLTDVGGPTIGALESAQVLDLVERYGSQVLWTDGPSSTSPAFVEALIDRARDLADAQGIDLVVNDRWGIAPGPTGADVTTLDRMPTDIVTAPWELARSLGPSTGHNRTERAEHLLATGQLLDVLTEVVAKGGQLLLGVGLGVDGTVSEVQQRPLREVGVWVRDHAEIIHGGQPFDQWGDAQVRYVVIGDVVAAIDLTAGSELVLAGLTPDRYDVHAIVADDGGAVHWEQHRAGVTVSRIDRSPGGLAGVYRITLRPAVEAIRLFDEAPPTPMVLEPLLAGVGHDGIVQLGEGGYSGPLHVPAGVTVRGMGWDRTLIELSGAVTVSAGATLENLHVLDPTGAEVSVDCTGDGAIIAGCRIDGSVNVLADDVIVRTVNAVDVRVEGERVTVERSTLKSDGSHDIGISVVGGAGHRIVRNEIVDHRCAIRFVDVSASSITENRIEANWWAVHLLRCDHVEVADNQMQHTMRAVDVNGGNGSVVTGNWVADGDSGAVIQFGATDTSVMDNHVERCRIGVLVWDAPATSIGPNTFVDTHEEAACVFGPDSDHDAA